MSSGSYTTSDQFKLDSENYIGGGVTGSYNIAAKINSQLVVTGAVSPQITYVAGTPISPTASPLSITIADLLAYFIMADQGTSAYPLILEITCTTTNIYVPLIANQPVWCDFSQLGYTAFTSFASNTPSFPTGVGIFTGKGVSTTYTGCGTSITGLALNIPAGLGLSSPGLVNFTARFAST